MWFYEKAVVMLQEYMRDPILGDLGRTSTPARTSSMAAILYII